MIAASLTLLGFFALAAAMPRHAPALLGRWEQQTRPALLQLLGWSLLAAALGVSIVANDWPLALVRWFGTLPVAGGCVLLGLTYDPRLARGAAVLSVLAMLASLLG